MTEDGKPEVILTFLNTHDAIASEQALGKCGMRVPVMPLPTQIGAGCGICLRVWPEALAQVKRILDANGIQVQGLWKKQPGGGKPQYTPFD